MCNEGQRVSPYSPRQSLALFMEDSTNNCCQMQRHNFLSSFHNQIGINCLVFYYIAPELDMLHIPDWKHSIWVKIGVFSVPRDVEIRQMTLKNK